MQQPEIRNKEMQPRPGVTNHCWSLVLQAVRQHAGPCREHWGGSSAAQQLLALSHATSLCPLGIFLSAGCSCFPSCDTESRYWRHPLHPGCGALADTGRRETEVVRWSSGGRLTRSPQGKAKAGPVFAEQAEFAVHISTEHLKPSAHISNTSPHHGYRLLQLQLLTKLISPQSRSFPLLLGQDFSHLSGMQIRARWGCVFCFHIQWETRNPQRFKNMDPIYNHYIFEIGSTFLKHPVFCPTL